MNKNIFLSSDSETISGKLTKTCVLETIPSSSIENKLNGWEKDKNTEWRWRFLQIGDKEIVEISYKNKNDDSRTYFSHSGEWVKRDIPNEYDKYVIKQFFYYN